MTNNMSAKSNINMSDYPTFPQDLLLEPFLVDDWLQGEIEQSGLMLNQDDLFQQQPLSASPGRQLVPIIPQSSSPVLESAPALHTPPTLCLGLDTPLSNPPSPPYSVSSTTTTTAKRNFLDDGPEDAVSKRRRNTDAARRSRLKKVHKMETLETRVGELTFKNIHLNTQVAVLESEKLGLEAKDRDLQARIRKLEEQLRQAHKMITSRLTIE